MKGAAWLAVQGLDGTEAYTRGGSLDIDADGNAGHDLGAYRPRRRRADPGPARHQVASLADGTVSATDRQRPHTSIGKLKLVTPEAPLTRGLDGLFRAGEGDCRPIRWRASRTARSRARTSARSRRWWR